LIAAILVRFFQFVRLPRNWAGGLAIPLIWFYTGATGWQASAIRSTIMSTVIILGWILRRPNNLLNSLSASAILILLWQPEQLFQAGFQLSFILLASFAVWPAIAPNEPWPEPAVHLGQSETDSFERKPKITLWSRALGRIYEQTTGRDPFLPSQLRPWWRRKMDDPIIFLLGGINISLASLLGSLPVIALYFNLISYSSLVANLVIVPISGITLASSLASWALAWFPTLSILANWISWGTMWFMVWFCRKLESFSWTYEYVQSPSALTIIAYYVTFLAVVNGWLRKKWALCSIIALVLIAAGTSIWREQTTTTITMLPGSGTIFIDRPSSGEDLLIDCGREREVYSMLKPFLHSRGVDSLEAVVLTHGDVTHVGGYSRLVEEFRVATTLTSTARSHSPAYRRIIRDLKDDPKRWRKIAEPDNVRGWTVLHPTPAQDYARADDEAVVLARTIEGHRILLLSELGAAGQERLLQSGADLKSEILFCGIGNDGHPPRPALLDQIKPSLIILSGNDSKSAKAAQELRARHWNVQTTREEGAVWIEIHAGKLDFRGIRR